MAADSRPYAIRPYQESDRASIYDVCLRTGAAGADASGQFRNASLLGDVFVGPYLSLESGFTSVVVGDDGVEGYVLGTADTRAFERQCARHWWPDVRQRYHGVEVEQGTSDAWLLAWIANPPIAPALCEHYPAHLHVDLLPSCQGGGWGRQLVQRFIAACQNRGVHGIHLGVDADNPKAAGFYRHLGFDVITEDERTIWMGLRFT